jgi:hypothetical protein
MTFGDYRDNDYTKYRSNYVSYSVADKIGRKDPTYVNVIQDVSTVSGTTASGITFLRTNYR